MPVWHASVAVLDHNHRPLPTDQLKPKQVRRAKALALELLEGVGALGHDKRERFPTAFHVRRKLTDIELARLPREWCAIEPEDLGGEGEPW